MRISFIALVLFARAAVAASFPDAHENPPAGWTGPVFKLSQDYPAAPPPAETYPWKAYDFATQPEEYIRAVYAYALKGNITTDWRGSDNAVRKWYHAPWMHYGNNGREFIHGMTRERNSRPRELAPGQTCFWQNWAVGLYNAPGGYVIGQVWANPDRPNAASAQFPDGTVSVKLLFTAAPESQVPYLRNGFRWQGNIDPVGAGGCSAPDPSGTRRPADLTLLQIDLAVRETRADATTGWIMGTLVYDGNAPGATPWERMVPVGVQWGNDPTLTPAKHAAGERVKESWINPRLGVPQHLGWLGRLNGPVDNPVSACLSCHGTAQTPALSPMVPRTDATDAQKMRWFRNVRFDEAFDAGSPRNPKPLGYSLQLAVGIQNQQRASSALRPEISNGVVIMAFDSGEESVESAETTVFPVSREEGVSDLELAAAAGEAPARDAAASAESAEAPAAAAQTRAAWAGAVIPLLVGIVLGVAIGFLLGRRRSS